MRLAWELVRGHFWAAAIVIALLAALLYPPIMLSSPVVDRTQFGGTVSAITHSGESWTGRPGRYGYQVIPSDGGQPVIVRGHAQHRVGDPVVIERVTRRNGNVSYQFRPMRHY